MTFTPIDHEHDPLELDPIQRDRWGRPLLIPAGGTEVDRTAYTRASTLASSICSDYGLTKWKMRRAAKGLSDREDLAAMGSALPKLTGDRKLDAPTNRELDFIIEEALIEGGALIDANYGTAVHGHTNPVHPQHDVERGPVPQRMQYDVESFWAALEEHDLEIVYTEVFVACDELMSAGTFDHIVRHKPTGRQYTLDKKTGDLHMFEFLLQITAYAHGDRYDPYTDYRYPLDVSRDLGIIAHIPRGQGRTDLYWLNLRHGIVRARQAKEIREDQRDDCAHAVRPFKEANA